MKVAQSCLTLCNPIDYSPWNSPGQNTGVGSLSLLQGIFPAQRLNPGLQLQTDSLPAEAQGKPKNTGVGSLYLLFLTQESNQSLLHCRRILYQLSYVLTTKEFSFFKSSFHCAWLKSATMTSTSLLYRKGAPTEHLVANCGSNYVSHLNQIKFTLLQKSHSEPNIFEAHSI